MMMMMMMIRKVIVVPVVIGALRAISVNFKEYMKRIGMNMRLEVIQKITLLGTAKMLRMWEEEKERPGTHGDLL